VDAEARQLLLRGQGAGEVAVVNGVLQPDEPVQRLVFRRALAL
jgi:hypothetical protein